MTIVSIVSIVSTSTPHHVMSLPPKVCAFGRRLAIAATILLGCLAASSPAQAQGFGVQAGVSADPEQFVIGAHYETAPFVDRLSFRPGVDVGFGDDLTAIAINFDLLYTFRSPRSAWSPYVGGGPAINIYDFENGNDDSDAEPGLNFFGGVKHDGGFFAEARLGTIDSPDFKFMVGWRFR